MKKYCPKCGKNIENETCECQNKKGIFTFILDFITKPVDTVNEFVNTISRENNYLLILITSLIISFSIIDTLSVFRSLFFFPNFRYLILITVLIIACFMIFTLILNLLIKQENNEMTFDETLKIVSSSSISLIYAFLITTIINILFNKYVLIIILIGIFIFGYLVIEMLKIKKIDQNKALLYFILTILIVILAITILF